MNTAYDDGRIPANPCPGSSRTDDGLGRRVKRVGVELVIPTELELRRVIQVDPDEPFTCSSRSRLDRAPTVRGSRARRRRSRRRVETSLAARAPHAPPVRSRARRPKNDDELAIRPDPGRRSSTDLRAHPTSKPGASSSPGSAGRTRTGSRSRRAGGAINGSTVSHWFADACERAGLERSYRWHDLRHFYASNLINSRRADREGLAAPRSLVGRRDLDDLSPRDPGRRSARRAEELSASVLAPLAAGATAAVGLVAAVLTVAGSARARESPIRRLGSTRHGTGRAELRRVRDVRSETDRDLAPRDRGPLDTRQRRRAPRARGAAAQTPAAPRAAHRASRARRPGRRLAPLYAPRRARSGPRGSAPRARDPAPARGCAPSSALRARRDGRDRGARRPTPLDDRRALLDDRPEPDRTPEVHHRPAVVDEHSAEVRAVANSFRAGNMRELFLLAVRSGWRWSRTGTNHIRLIGPAGGVLTLSTTANDRGRGWLNQRASAKRYGLNVDGL